MTDYKEKYSKYKAKYTYLKYSPQTGGKKFNIIRTEPKYKYVHYHDNSLYIANNIDSDVLNENSQFMLGSVSKVFTAFVILLLSQKNKLNLSDFVDKYIPSTQINNFSNITIFQLLNHTAGIKRFPTRHITKEYLSATDVFNSINEPCVGDKSGMMGYSNIGYMMLGVIIENITGLTYIDAYNKYLFEKLELKNTGIGRNNISLYTNDIQLNESQFNERYFACTAGALYSSVSDLYKFGKNIMTLFDEKETIKSLYFFKKEPDTLVHMGGIDGGESIIKIKYDKDMKMTGINILLKTNTISTL